MGLLVDCHAHLDHKAFELDLPEVIKRAENAGLTAILSAGINPETNRKTLEIARRFPIIKPVLGIYPVEALMNEASQGEYPITAKDFNFDAEVHFIERQRERIIAVGEIGLDFSSGKDKEAQRRHFIALLRMARSMKKPVVVHSRKAEKEVIDILEDEQQKKVLLHCFSGNAKLIRRAESLKFCFSIPANITISSHFQNLVKLVHIEQLFTETDSPYLSPIKGQRNEPWNVAEGIRKISEIKKLDPKETENLLYQNFQQLFL